MPEGRIGKIAVAMTLLLLMSVPAFAQAPPTPQAPFFTPGNLVVSVAGCGVYGGTPPNTTPNPATCATAPVGGTGGTTGTGPNSYGDDQGAPWNLWQYTPNGATSVTFVNSIQLPQNMSGANFPVSDDYGSQSEGTLQLSGNGLYLTMVGYGLNAATFNVNYLNYCPGSTMLGNACVPENGNPAMAQTGTLLGQTYSGNTPVPRVAVLIDANGNVNSSTVLYGIYNQNDARSAYSPDGISIYVSGQGCKNWDATNSLCDNPNTLYDDTQGVYLTTLGANNFFGINNPIAITGPDNGPEPCSSLTTCTESQSTRMVQIYNNTLYVSMDDKGGNNRSFIGTLGDPPSTSVFTCTGVGGGCGTGYGPYGPAEIPGLVNTGGTGKYTLNTAGGNNTSNGNNLNAGLKVNLSPQNFWFASSTVLYVADTGSPKNHSNGPDAVCTTDGTTDSGTAGDGGLQKWILNPTVTVSLTSGSATASASSGAFTQGEVGLPISGTGIPPGTTITAVSSAGANATLSANATVTHSESVTVSGWSLQYTLYNGLNLVLNADCDPSSPTTPGSLATTGLYGVTGVVNNGVATLYVTTYPNNDLVQTYLYGITDTLSTTTMTTPGTAFTLLDTAPAGSILRGVSFVPQIQNGAVMVTTVPSGLTVTSANTGCAPSTFTTPLTLTWIPTSTCQSSVATPQAGPTGIQYAFVQWQDGTTSTTDNVTAPASTATNTYTYTATFATQYQLTTSATTGGTVSPSGFYTSGTNAIITATPSAGYYFVNFTGTIPTSTTNPLTVDMTAPESVTANFVAQTSQAITFTPNPPQSAAYGSQFTVAAAGGASGNPVTFTSSGACNNVGATYTMISGTGTCSVIANQAGNTQYSAAPQVIESVTATMASGSGSISVTAASVASSVYPNQGDTLSATVTVVGGGAPAGAGETVSFYAGATLLGTGTLSTVDANDSSTSITITGSQLTLGGNSVTAVYSGDANYSSTTSAAITVTLLSSLVTFGSSNVGTPATGQTLNYTFTSATTLTAVNILTLGASGLDYTDGGSSTCTATGYTAGQSCVVTVALTPTAPGARAGAVTLFAQGRTLPLMTWYLSGVGNSGAVTIDPGTLATTTLTGTATPAGYGSAVDGAGNVYVVDHANNAVLKLAAGTFSQSTVVSGLSGPTGVALDGAGDLYISNDSSVVMIPNENGTLNAADQSTVNLSGLGSARGVAVDANGDLYVADATNGDVVELSSLGVQTTIASGLTSPHGVAVDAALNVYVATSGAVTQYPYGGGAAVPYGTGYNNPRGVAVDAAGAVYVADTGNNQIVRVSPGGGSQATVPVTGVSSPQGVSVDASDNLYVTDSSIVIQVNRTQAAQLTFPATNVGSTSPTQVVTVTDAGNGSLQVSNLAISANFASEASGGVDCTSSTNLSAGGQCEIGVAFKPTVTGPLTGTVSLSNNALNNTVSTLTVPLSGGGTQVPSISSGNSTTFTVGTLGSFTVTATGYPAPTFSETGALPSGVTLSTAGVLSGTPAAGTGGAYNISITASNSAGTSAAQSFTLTVDQAPAITSGAGTTFVIGTAGSFTVTATGYPAPTFSETGALPSGVTLSTAGVLSGTPAAGTAGTYTLTVTASNGVGTNAAQSFILTVGQVPVITSANKATFTVGTAGTFMVTATGYPAPTFSETGALPSGVTLSAAGALSGTPAAGTGGIYNISITAGNAAGTSAAQSFTLTVDQAPAITSAANTTFTTGTAGSFTITATGYPAPIFSRTGTLPTGVTFSTATGVLSGTPAAGTAGTYTLNITASNGVGTNANQTFILTVDQVPAITSANKATFTVGTAGSFTVTATGSPAPTFSETGALPSGMTLSAAGVLSGTPGAGTGGVYTISITASNSVGTSAAQSFTLTVDQVPAITSGAGTTFATGIAGSFAVTASGYPAPTFTRTGTLPSGVTFSTSTGVLSGTPAASAGGSYTLTFTATNSSGTSAPQTFTLTVDQVPTVTSAAKTTFTVGTAGSFTVTGKGYPAPTFSETGALPSGVTLSAAGVLSGTPAAGTGGAYNISVTASNAAGTSAAQSFTLIVDQVPAITSGASATFTTGTAGSFTVTATGYPAPTFTRTGTLPSGVTFSTSTGLLSGTPGASAGGSYTLTFAATNSSGTSAPQTFTLTVDQVPAVTSAAKTTFTVGSAGSFTVTAKGYPAPTFSETGALPSGVTLSAAGVLSGTPAAGTGGAYNISVTASNAAGTSAAQSFTLTVGQAPAITSVAGTTFTIGTAGSFTVTATGYPPPTFTRTGTLPSGVTFSAGGVLSGTPAAGTAGTYTLHFTASNGVGANATQTFTLTVN